jgi:hypothetical protein
LAANEAIPPQIDDLVLDCIEPRERRLESARLFMARLAGALSEPSKPLSDVLAHGKLHELSSAIENLSASEFAALPAGQKVLILSKIADIVGSNESSLIYASERLLQLMLTRGVLLDSEGYREIVSPAIKWAFSKDFEGRIGRDPLRRTLEEAAFLARDGAYEVLKDEFLAFFATLELENKEDWYLHTIREVIEARMANPTCATGAIQLGEAYRQVNKIQRSRPKRLSAYH